TLRNVLANLAPASKQSRSALKTMLAKKRKDLAFPRRYSRRAGVRLKLNAAPCQPTASHKGHSRRPLPTEPHFPSVQPAPIERILRGNRFRYPRCTTDLVDRGWPQNAALYP